MSDQVVLTLIAAVVLVLLVVIYQYRHEISISGKRGKIEFKVEARNAAGETHRSESMPEQKRRADAAVSLPDSEAQS